MLRICASHPSGYNRLEHPDTSNRRARPADGRRVIRVRICEAVIERQAQRAALAGMMAARAEVARAHDMLHKIRAEVLRDLNQEIANMRRDGSE